MKMTFPTTNHSQFSSTARAMRFNGNDTQATQQPKGKNKMTLEQMDALEAQCDEIHLSEAKPAHPKADLGQLPETDLREMTEALAAHARVLRLNVAESKTETEKKVHQVAYNINIISTFTSNIKKLLHSDSTPDLDEMEKLFSGFKKHKDEYAKVKQFGELSEEARYDIFFSLTNGLRNPNQKVAVEAEKLAKALGFPPDMIDKYKGNPTK